MLIMRQDEQKLQKVVKQLFPNQEIILNSKKSSDIPKFAARLLYHKTTSFKSDVYSFSITLWEIITPT